MAEPSGNIPMTGGAGNVINLLKMFKGTSSTTSSNISQEGMNALLQQVLGSTQGLAAVAGGQRSAGMYNSTTNQMLLNDLITRTAGELEARRAGTTTRTPAQFGLGDIGSMLGMQALGQLAGPTLKGLGEKVGLKSAGEKLAEQLGLKTVAKAGASAGGAAGTAAEIAAGSGVGLAELGAAAGGAGGFGTAATGAVDVLGDFLLSQGIVDAAGFATGSAAAAGMAEAAGLGLAEAAGAGAAAAGTGAALAGGAEVLGGLAGVAEAGFGLAEAATLAEAGAAAAGGSGIISTIISFLGSLFSDERLKTDVTPVGVTFEGQPIYTYKYKDEPVKTHMGVLAQETLAYHPEAVHRHPSGALMVDYDRILGIK